MGKDHIGYDELMDNALRGAMRAVMERVAENGLIGSHHLYITFRTGFPGVDIPDYLRDRYPDELTIVMQHQYWGLEVTERGFSVTLSFNKAREHISIPFAALTRFADPGVKFGLQFESQATGRSSKLELVADPGEASDGDGSDEGASVEDGLQEIPEIPEINVGQSGLAHAFAPEVHEANNVNYDDGEDGDAAAADQDGEERASADDEPDEESSSGAEVVTLDSFRKK